ncbi:hypothetical protein [Aeromicrobium sp. CTD01-1L150]|uniref:hypothetical protein n=1 Tax=Aeromicrobium sp. CTD01-1L150 TaxID=3341830 RepID=UPI0035BEC1F4
MRSLPLRLAAALTAATLLAACGGGSDDSDADNGTDEPTTSVEAASGETASTDDFSFTAPEGWNDVTDDIPGFDPEIAYAAQSSDSDFNDNVNVVREPNAFDGTAEEYADANVDALSQGGYDEPRKIGTFDDWVVVAAGADQNGVTYVVNQYYTVVDDQGWVVTFSFAGDTPEDERSELADSVMQTWAWA